ncbi:SrfA family protein [Brenneria rubrifaciens]|uniref:Virulence effector protein n=1 Tax=Brenneria rubrifaciens TaxID=55213 RepID=A0A4P8QT09_9GAMM|nr:SrfA family protein [Brenneria rubrifaciens]QCR08609.1 hypothetical protein EH207_08785 [Brenneria rubrifaciens]
MAKLFLRSGSLDDFLALGENGQPVYASALQLRETLRLRKQPQIADCLAIPQPNENGDRIDWYSPIEGKVTSWIAASEKERDMALKRLEAYQSAVADISQHAQSAEKAGQKLFGVLLAKALQFPGPNHVYLVDGNPVLTFWGFVNLDKKSRTDALDCLRPAEKESEPEVAVPTSFAPPEEPATPSAPKPELVVTPAAVPARSPWLTIGWWLLPAAALMAVLTFQIRGCVSEQNASPAPAPLAATNKPEKRALPASVREPQAETPVYNSAAPLSVPPEIVSAEPVIEEAAPAEAVVVETPAAKPPVATEPKESAPVPVESAPTPAPEPEAPVIQAGKDELVMPADAVRLGSIKFLNGSWRIAVDAKTPPITGRPPSLRYQIKNGKGTARITHGDGVTCRANIEAGLMSSGNLIINSRTKARCSDDSRFQMPEIVCKQSANGAAAECIGRYDANAIFPMTIKRESKS